MIVRIWHGYTSEENAAAYEHLLKTEIFPEIEAKTAKGYKGVQLLRRSSGNEIEFTTMIWFEDLEAVKSFVGEDYETAYIPDKARKLLSHFDQKVVHSELQYDTL